MRLGLSSFAFGWAVGFEGSWPSSPMTPMDLIRKAHELQIGTVQIADNLPLESLSASALSELRRIASDNCIQIEIGARCLTSDRMELVAGLARTFGASFVRFVIDDSDYHPSLPEIERVLKEGLPRMEGVILAIENHDRFKAVQLRALLESVAGDRVAICLDTANSLGAGEGIDEVLNQLEPWVVNVHIKDISISRIDTKMGFRVEGRPAGAGQIDIPALLQRLHRTGRCQSATLELWTPREATLEATVAKESQWVSESCEYLKPLLKQLSNRE
jgi:3-oxoisoapionate decarboxylase